MPEHKKQIQQLLEEFEGCRTGAEKFNEYIAEVK